MAEIFQQNNSYFLEINNIKNSKIQKLSPEIKFKHFIVFCGKGLNFDLINRAIAIKTKIA